MMTLTASRPLTPYEKWMVRSNLARIESGETTKTAVIKTLRDNGYHRIANAVKRSRK